MHELSLAESIFEQVYDVASRAGVRRVRIVRLEIGRLASVEVDALRFCFDSVVDGTVAHGAQLEVVEIPGVGTCLDCGRTVAVDDRLAGCPHCGGYRVQVTGGTEMRVKELEAE